MDNRDKEVQRAQVGSAGSKPCSMEQYRFAESETATPTEGTSQSSLSEPGTPSPADAQVSALRECGDSAASIPQGKVKTKKVNDGLPILSVIDGFRQATVLLTGATGYVGSLVLEQLFRTCPDISRVYVVIRASKDRQGNEITAHERLQKLLCGPEFQTLHPQLESVLERITVIPGDLSTPGLGLAAEDRQRLCDETSYVIHCAASIRFDEPISTIMHTNYACTHDLLRLASAMPNLRCFTYMSTAYVNSNLPRHSTVREEIYPLPGTEDPFEVAQALLDLPEKVASKLAVRLMKQWGLINTYFVAKTLSERLVMSFDHQPFPVCIVRPSLIGCVAGQPFPGYVGNTSGFTALVLGTLSGIIKFVQHDPMSRIALVPGDVVSSATLAATVGVAEYPGLLSNIVHICSSESYPLLNCVTHATGASFMHLDPVNNKHRTLSRNGDYRVAWVKRRSVFKARCLLRGVKLHALGLVLQMYGNARLAKKITMAHKLWSLLGARDVDYDFTFKTPTTDRLYEMMPPEERNIIKPVWNEELGDSWLRYLRTYSSGVKHLYLHEPPRGTDMQDYRPRKALEC